MSEFMEIHPEQILSGYNTYVCSRCGKKIKIRVNKNGLPELFCEDCSKPQKREEIIYA